MAPSNENCIGLIVNCVQLNLRSDFKKSNHYWLTIFRQYRALAFEPDDARKTFIKIKRIARNILSLFSGIESLEVELNVGPFEKALLLERALV